MICVGQIDGRRTDLESTGNHRTDGVYGTVFARTGLILISLDSLLIPSNRGRLFHHRISPGSRRCEKDDDIGPAEAGNLGIYVRVFLRNDRRLDHVWHMDHHGNPF